MKRLIVGTLVCLLSSTALWAPPQTQPAVVVVSSPPSGSCTSNEVRVVKSTGDHYACLGSAWTLLKVSTSELAATNSPAASLVLSVDPLDTTKIQYVVGGGSGGGGASIVKECSGAPPCAGTSPISSVITTYAFGLGFDLTATTTTSSADTANVTLDLSETPVNLSTGSTQVTGTLPVTSGGTNATTASGARSNLSAAELGANSTITSLSGLTTPLSVTQGGTGLAAVAANQVMTGTSANTLTAKTIPNCLDSSGNHLNFDQSSQTWTCGNTGTGGVSGYGTVQNNPTAGSAGSNLTARTILGVITAPSGTGTFALQAADDASPTRTNITLYTSPASASAVVGTGRTITPGAGLGSGTAALPLSSDIVLTTDSTEANFITSGTLTCGASTAGKMEVAASAPLQYCDATSTPVLRYAAFADSSGRALTGDDATAFFTTGILESARGGTGVTSLGSNGNVLYTNSGNVGNSNSFNYNSASDTLQVGTIQTTSSTDGSRRLDLLGNTAGLTGVAAVLGTSNWYANGTAGAEIPFFRTFTGGVQQLSIISSTETLTNKTITAPVITATTVAALPTASSNTGKIYIVTDSNSTTACTTGSSSSIVLCRSNGTTWQALGDGSSSSTSAGGSNTELQYNNSGSVGGMSGVTWTSGSSAIATADGTLVNLSAINNSATTEGLRLPQVAGAGSGTAQGQINWDTTNKQLGIGDSSAVQKIPTGLVRSVYWAAGGLSTDGTNCSTPSEVTLNSGPKTYVTACAYNAAGTIHGSVDMPDGWDGGTLTFEPELYNKNATPANILSFDIVAMCRRDGNGTTDAVNSTYGTLQTATFTQSNFATTEMQQVTTAALTPSGTCSGGAHLFWKATVNTGTSTATQSTNSVGTSDIFLLGVKMEYTMASGD